ncbi:hypothetical protein GWK47_033238 [Chionoecetes opilio]|uniref:Uncharacterized protein n=1 Tax=Chionoecetes opilio TaxID=41210 RepID=A0A8J4YJ79_CHIOP|nr:hypothetical protein GWK47_033238 [Chionoecetes opilio]
MTFWQENYGFVKEVYDFRCSKYLEWMDNIEAIIGKVMANTQYTAKEFKIIKDTFTVKGRLKTKEEKEEVKRNEQAKKEDKRDEENVEVEEENMKEKEKIQKTK